MSWRYGPIFAVPMEVVVGSWYVDKAIWTSVSGTFWEGFRSVGAQA